MKKFLLALAAAASLPAAADEWNGPDKKMHFAVSYVVGFAAGSQWPDNKLLAFGVAMIPGTVKEISDRSGTGFSGKDMAFNAIGAALGVASGSFMVTRHAGTTVVAYRSEF